jgi:hypothetical protein
MRVRQTTSGNEGSGGADGDALRFSGRTRVAVEGTRPSLTEFLIENW